LITVPKHVEFPLAIFMVPAIGVMASKFLAAIWLYQAKVPCTLGQRFAAAVAAMGLSYTVAQGILAGIKSASTPFFRTPKCENKPALMQGFMMAWQEMTLFGAALIAALATFIAYGPYNEEAKLWIIMLLVQSIPYGAALATSLVAAMPGRRRAVSSVPAPAPIAPPQPLMVQATISSSNIVASGVTSTGGGSTTGLGSVGLSSTALSSVEDLRIPAIGTSLASTSLNQQKGVTLN
jgi:hypothetical protein